MGTHPIFESDFDCLTEMSLVRELIKRFPLNQVRSGFGYGSSVFPQKGNDGKDRQIDMILICDSLEDFHSANLLQNKEDYAPFMRNKKVESLVDWNNRAAGLFFNAFVQTEFGELKYGVVSTENAIKDLRNWDHLYLSGRLHKPVKFVSPKIKDGQFDLSESLPGEELGKSINENLISALRLSTLMQIKNGEKTNIDTVIKTICSLSYLGDIRTKGFEDTKKVDKIFEGSYNNLQHLYRPVLNQCDWLEFSEDGSIYQKRDVESVKNQLEKLPSQIDLGIHYRDVLIDHKLLSQVLQTEITRIVKQSSVAQTKTNFFTSGPVRSVNYGLAKVKKYLRSVK